MTVKSCGGCIYFIKVTLRNIDRLRIGFCDKLAYKVRTDCKCKHHSPIHESRKKKHSPEYIKMIDVIEYNDDRN